MLLAASSSDPGAQVTADILIVLGIIAYWVPSIVAAIRKVPNLGSVVVIDLFLGWTVIGWVVALAMAVRSRPTAAAVPPAGPQSFTTDRHR